MRPRRRVQALIFDMDGVLMHSTSIHAWAFREALACFPGAAFEYADIAGMRTDEALREILTKNAIPVEEARLREIAQAKTQMAREAIARENPVDPDCATVLEALHGEYRLALASSASAETVNVFLDRNGLRRRFEHVLTGGDVRRAKPAPDIYLEACSRLDLQPADCLVIEDAVSGVAAGKAAGAAVWAIASTSPAADLERAGADRVTARLSELLELVENPCPAL